MTSKTPAPAETAPAVVAFEDAADIPAREYAARATKPNPYAGPVAEFVAAYLAAPESAKAKRGSFADVKTAERAARLIGKAARDCGVTMRKSIKETDGRAVLTFWFTPLVQSKPRGPRVDKANA